MNKKRIGLVLITLLLVLPLMTACQKKNNNKPNNPSNVDNPTNPDVPSDPISLEYKTGTKDVVSVIYFNPIMNKKCEAKEENCMKWYAIENSSEYRPTVAVILDHNTTDNVVWNGSENSANKQLSKDVSKWNAFVKNTARLINANDIAKIVKIENFNSSLSLEDKWFYFDGAKGEDAKWQTPIASIKDKSDYAWLYDNLSNCEDYGCDKENKQSEGYWTQDTVLNNQNKAWSVDYQGRLSNSSIDNTSYGIRPVILINKDVLK